MRRKFMSMALTAAMVLSMAATPVFAEDTASDEGFNLNLCIASEPQTIDPALNSAVDGAIMCNHMFEGLAKWVNDGERKLLSQLLDRLSPGKRPRTKMVQLLTLLNFVTESNGLMDRL